MERDSTVVQVQNTIEAETFAGTKNGRDYKGLSVVSVVDGVEYSGAIFPTKKFGNGPKVVFA